VSLPGTSVAQGLIMRVMEIDESDKARGLPKT
jgi:hypothetical protein